MRPLRKKKRGYTLVELLVAMILLAIGMTTMIAGLRFSLRTAAVSDETATALASARMEMERLYAKAFDDPDLQNGTRTVNRTGYSFTYTVSGVSATIKQVQLVLQYKGYTGAARQIRLTMQKARGMG